GMYYLSLVISTDVDCTLRACRNSSLPGHALGLPPSGKITISCIPSSVEKMTTMPKFHNNFSLAKLSISLIFVLLVSATAIGAFAQEDTSNSATTPLVYDVENTGANFAAPSFPNFAQLPIIRPLPDPFRFVDGTRDTSLANWERRRQEIKA